MSNEWGHTNKEQKPEFSSEMNLDQSLFDSTNVEQLETDPKLVQNKALRATYQPRLIMPNARPSTLIISDCSFN